MKTAKDYLTEANSVVERISPNEGIERYNKGNLVVVDVRDSSAFPETGTVQGALRIPRGLIEFVADDTHPMHNGALKKRRSDWNNLCRGRSSRSHSKNNERHGF